MGHRFSRLLFCLILVSASQIGDVWESAAKDRGLPRTTKELHAWIASRLPDDKVLQIAWVGISPGLSAAAVQSEDGFTATIRQGNFRTVAADQQVVTVLRAAAPRLRLVVAPLMEADVDNAVALAEAIRWAASQRPDVLYVPAKMFDKEAFESEAVTTALVESWSNSVLPLTVVDSEEDRVPAGMLSVVDRSGTCGSTPWTAKKGFDLTPPLRLPPDIVLVGIDEERSCRTAAIYTALLAATVWAGAQTAHLERASLLRRHLTEEEARLKVLSGADPGTVVGLTSDKPTVFLGDDNWPWNTRVVDVARIIRVAPPISGPNEVKRRILVGVNGQTFLRHLAAIGELTGMIPIFLAPSKHGIMTYRANRLPTIARSKRILALLGTLRGYTSDDLLYAIAPDRLILEHRG